MSSIIRLTESCNKISVKTAILTWTGTAVLIKMCQIHPSNRYHKCNRWKEKQNYSISTFPHTSGSEKKNWFALVTSLSQHVIQTSLNAYE